MMPPPAPNCRCYVGPLRDDRTVATMLLEALGALFAGIGIAAYAQYAVPLPPGAEMTRVELCGVPCNQHVTVHYEVFS